MKYRFWILFPWKISSHGNFPWFLLRACSLSEVSTRCNPITFMWFLIINTSLPVLFLRVSTGHEARGCIHSWCCASQLWDSLAQASFGFGQSDRRIRYRMSPTTDVVGSFLASQRIEFFRIGASALPKKIFKPRWGVFWTRIYWKSRMMFCISKVQNFLCTLLFVTMRPFQYSNYQLYLYVITFFPYFQHQFSSVECLNINF